MKKTIPMLISVTGPSGTGKDAVINALLAQDPGVKRFVSATTRPPRPGERHGTDYYFMTPDEFDQAEKNGEFYETNRGYHGKNYGKLKRVIDDYMAQGLDVIADLEINGVRAFAGIMPARQLKILMLPPSRERLEQRLTGRNPAMAEEGRKRLEAARADLDHLHDPTWVFTNPDMQGSSYADYDVVLINDVFDTTVAELAKIIKREREKRA